jgi:hypothetical protein
MILAKAYCSFLLIHGGVVLVAPRLAGSGLGSLLWVLFPGLMSLVVLGLALDRRLFPVGPLVLVGGGDVVVRFGLALLGSIFWMKTLPMIGGASMVLGVLGWVLTQSFRDSGDDDRRRLDEAIMNLPESTRSGRTK